MPRTITSPGGFYVPYGKPNIDTIYINEVNYDNWESFKFVKKLNQMGSFEIKLAGVEQSDRTNICEGKEVKIFNEYFLIFKGRIERVEYEQDFYCTIKGFGMEVDLTKYEVTREEYVSTNTTTIVKELLSENMDGISPWIVNEGVNTDWGDITLKGEYDNRLRFLSNLAETIGYDWWVSQNVDGLEELDSGLYSTANDYFHIDTRKGSPSSVKTFYTGGNNQNATVVNREVDKENMCNYVNVLGYGEGINQVTASFYNASTVTTTLNETLTTTDIRITLAGTSGLSSAGTVRIGDELVKYASIYSSDLMGCTRASSQATSKAHPTGIFVEKHFAIADAEVGSSIGNNGLAQRTFERRDLISQQMAQCIASDLLFKLKNPIERIYLTLDDVRFSGVEIGDAVTIVDVDLSLNGTYRIVGAERGNTLEQGEYLIYECSNQSVSVMEDLADTTRRSDVETKYAMGTMTAENLSEKENIDASHYLTMTFYLPQDVIRINKALLSFKLSNFRAYLTSQTSTEDTDKNVDNYTYNVDMITLTNDINWHDVTDCTITRSATAAGFIFVFVECDNNDTLTSVSSMEIRIKNTTDNTYYPNTAGLNIGSFSVPNNENNIECLSGTILIPDSLASKTLLLQYICANPDSADIPFRTTWTEIGTHTHNTTFGISEQTLTSPLVTVYVGYEGLEISTLSTSTTNVTDYDVTSILSSSYISNGAGWYDVAFQGNKNMRIDSNLFLKYFIESK